jgi:hypothetical protein
MEKEAYGKPGMGGDNDDEDNGLSSDKYDRGFGP